MATGSQQVPAGQVEMGLLLEVRKRQIESSNQRELQQSEDIK